MKKLNIRVKEARIKSFAVSMNEEGKPDVAINVGLIIEGGREIASYQISTSGWGDNKIEVPENIHPSIAKILDVLTAVVIRHANGEMYALAEGSMI